MTDLTKSTQGVLKTVSKANPARDNGPLSHPKGMAAAAVALAAAPFVVERVAELAGPKASEKASDLKDQAKRKAKEQVKDTVGELTPEMPKRLFGGGGGLKGMFGGGDDDEGAGDGRAAPGHGSGRRMPIQQSVDVAVPIKEAYNQWTQFEDWPDFMHRLESVDQADDTTVTFQTKVWGIKKRFEAEILEQRPDERIEWNVSQGFAHTGVVTFHELSDRLTRLEVTMDVEPDNLVDKASRGLRFVKRAVRGDLHRFKAYIELKKEAEGGWRGTIEDGKVKRRTERRSSGRSSGGGSPRSSRNGSRSNRRARGSSGRSKAASRR
jgi:uncharacterized membrane protein